MGYYDDPATRKFKEQEQNATAQALLKIIAENDKQAAADKPSSVLKDYRSPALIAQRKREEVARKAAAAGEDPRVTKFAEQTARMDTVVGKDYRSEDAKKASSEALYKRRYYQFMKENPDQDPAVQEIIKNNTVKVKNKDVPAEAVLKDIWRVLSDPNSQVELNRKSGNLVGINSARQARNKAIDDFNKIKDQLSPELRAAYNIDALEAEGAFKKEAGASAVSNLGAMGTMLSTPLRLVASTERQGELGLNVVRAALTGGKVLPGQGPSMDQFVKDFNDPNFGFGTVIQRGQEDELRRGGKVPGTKLNSEGKFEYTSVDLPGFLPTVRPTYLANTAAGVTADLVADPLNLASLGAGEAANAGMRSLSRAGEHAIVNKIQLTGVKSLTAAEKAGAKKVLENSVNKLSRGAQKAGGAEALAARQWAALEKSGQSGIRIGGKTVIPSGITAIDTGLRKAFTPAAKLAEKIGAIRGGAKVVEEVGREFGPEDISRPFDKIGVDGPKAAARTAEEATQLAATHPAAIAARDAAFEKAQRAAAAAAAEPYEPILKDAAVKANADHAAAVRAADAVDPAKLAANPNHGAAPAFVQERNLPHTLETAPAYKQGEKNNAVSRIYGTREVDGVKHFTMKDGTTIRVPVERPRGLPGSEGSWSEVPEGTKTAAHNENSRIITVGDLMSRPTDTSLLIKPHSDVKDLIRVGEHVPGLYGILKEVRDDGLWVVQGDRSLFKGYVGVPDDVARKLAATVDGTGGFIADPTTGAQSTEGFVVLAVRSPSATVPNPQVTDSLIADFVDTNGSLFENPANKLRVRTDKAENSILDVVEVFGNEADAFAAAAARGEDTVRDLANNASKDVPPAGGTGTVADDTIAVPGSEASAALAANPDNPAVLASEGYYAKYGEELGLPAPSAVPADTKAIDDLARKMAKFYADAPPVDEAARASFEAMAKEVDQQYRYLTEELGIKVEFQDTNPYATHAEMIDDVVNNKRLKVLKSETYVGAEFHPFLSVEQNDKFRAVHDFFGHAAQKNSFSRDGEEIAWRIHGQMFSKDALPAMTSETRLQNSYLNFSEANEARRARGLDAEFGPQKALLPPAEFMEIPGIEATATDAEKLAARDATIAAREVAMGPVPDTPVDPLKAAADRRSAAQSAGDTLPVTGPVRDPAMPRLGDDTAVMKWWRDLFVRRGNIRAAERSGAVKQGSADVLHRGLTTTKRRAETLANEQATRIQAFLDAGVAAVGADDMWEHFNNAFDPTVATRINPRTGLPRAGKTSASPVAEVVADLRARAAAELKDPDKAAKINKFADMMEGTMSDVVNLFDDMNKAIAISKGPPRASEELTLDVGRAETRALPPRTLSEQGQKALNKMNDDQLKALNMLDSKGKRKLAGDAVLGESGILRFPTPTAADPAKYVEINLAGSTQEISDSIVAAIGDDFKKALGIEDGDPFNMLDNVAQSYAYGSRDAFRSTGDQQMLQHFAENDIVHVIYDGVDGQAPAPKGWVKVDSYSIDGQREVWAEHTIAEEMRRNASIIRNDKELRAIKKTADEVGTFIVRQFMSPTTKLVGFQMRNATTNNIMYAYFGGTLSGIKESWRLLTGPMRNINRLIKTDGMSFEQAIAHLVKNENLSARDAKIIEKIRELSVISSGQQRTLLSKSRGTLRTEYGGQALAKRALSPSDPGFIPNRVMFKPGEALNRGVEDLSRVALFISIFDKTGNFDTALEVVNRGLIDYTDVTRFESTSVKRWMAFYTYLRKNTAAMVQVAMDHPAYINRTLRAKQALSDSNNDLLTSSDGKRGNQQSGGLMRALIGGPSAFKIDDPVTGAAAAVSPFFQGAYWGLDKASGGKIYGSLPPSERPKFTDISSSVIGMAAGGPAEFVTAIYELSTGRNFKTGAKFEDNDQLMALVNGILPVWEQGFKLKNDLVQGEDIKRRTTLIRLLAGITAIDKGSEESKYLVLNAMRQDWDYNIKELNKNGGTIPDWQTLVDAELFKKIQPPRTVQPTTDMKKAAAIKTLTTPTTPAERAAAVKKALSFAPTTTTPGR